MFAALKAEAIYRERALNQPPILVLTDNSGKRILAKYLNPSIISSSIGKK